MEILRAVKGFKDILPDEASRWRLAEERVRATFHAFGFREIRVPIMERTELFRRGIGETTDIVEKEMYTFTDRGEESLTLRPEATASVIRAYLEHAFYSSESLTRLYTMGPMFRRERPQKGRFRQFHQLDAEVLGSNDPRVDAELILLLLDILVRVGIEQYRLEVNSLGCTECRPAFRNAMVSYLKDRENGLCPDCRRRLETNPLRVFDCKVPDCRTLVAEAPLLPDYLCQPCRDHFSVVEGALRHFGVPYQRNARMVRGLDYYTRTAFEVISEGLGAQNAIAGGGRYDKLVRDLGGPDIPGIGFAIGMERLLSLLPELPSSESGIAVFTAALGEAAQAYAFGLTNRLRRAGITADMDYEARSLKSQMKRADRLRAHYVLVIGDREMEEGQIPLRNMHDSTQSLVPMTAVEETLNKLLVL